MNMKKLLAIFLIIAMALTFAACGGGNDDQAAQDTPMTYKVAMEPTFPPFDTINQETQELDGFDVDLMNAIAEDQGFELEWVNMGFDGLITALQAGNIDIIASGMNASEERREKVDFSTTYYDSGLVVAVKTGNTAIKSIDDLTADMKAGAQIGTTGADLATELFDAGKIKEAKIYNGLDVAVMDLQNGTINALINDLPVTKAYMDVKPGTIEIVGDVLNAESYGFAVQKGNTELLDKINAGMQNIIDNGTFDDIAAEWFE
ncbi:MAG: basic amino acid ABC transporter substrate-binding protein [Eubacteriales bacterium]|nr:basic amino acid ABC transporter substrate-binding protein [Eubacteriales bacterium]MDD3199012.1 basic amino acid ABC transporter substrate-binding protein [Eubacteriales bacterium]MDD4121828.1 basic amino acid ABC transporter substrate-binding protein [Eubacteriales bacterium]MDD4629502.1 basic amino acid ABC transporter substrate-binding protein [Eubacteriales bacterium]